MNLIDVYIQEVIRRLPEKSREDIALELRSTIEDMLPDVYSETEVKEVLKKLGSPAALANGYQDRPLHLIGPAYFDVYVSLLKMIFPIAAVVTLISIIAQNVIGYSGEAAIMDVVITIIGEAIWRTIDVGIQVFFWITLTFAIVERVDKEKCQQPLTTSLQKWTPDDLKNIPYIPKKKAISKFEVFGSLMWTAIWATFYFYANKLVGVYEGGNRLDLVIPAFNQEVLLQYWPIIVLVIGFEIVLALYKLLKSQWTKSLAIWNTVLQIMVTVVFIVIITNPYLMSQEFITYATNLFTITEHQFKNWIVGGGITFFMIGAAFNVYDGFSKARAS